MLGRPHTATVVGPHQQTALQQHEELAATAAVTDFDSYEVCQHLILCALLSSLHTACVFKNGTRNYSEKEIWNSCDGNKLHAINPTVGVTKQNDSRSRRDAVILNRLQIVTRVLHAHISLVMTKHSVRHVILH